MAGHDPVPARLPLDVQLAVKLHHRLTRGGPPQQVGELIELLGVYQGEELGVVDGVVKLLGEAQFPGAEGGEGHQRWGQGKLKLDLVGERGKEVMTDALVL